MEFLLTNAVADRDWATWVTSHLDAAGYSSRQTPPTVPGQDPLAAIEAAQAAGKASIVLISYDYLETLAQSGASMIGRCQGSEKVLLVRIEDIPIPDCLEGRQIVDVFDVAGDYGATTDRLYEALGPADVEDPRTDAPAATRSHALPDPQTPGLEAIPSSVIPPPNPSADVGANELATDPVDAAAARLAALGTTPGGTDHTSHKELPDLPGLDALNPRADTSGNAPPSWTTPAPLMAPPASEPPPPLSEAPPPPITQQAPIWEPAAGIPAPILPDANQPPPPQSAPSITPPAPTNAVPSLDQLPPPILLPPLSPTPAAPPSFETVPLAPADTTWAPNNSLENGALGIGDSQPTMPTTPETASIAPASSSPANVAPGGLDSQPYSIDTDEFVGLDWAEIDRATIPFEGSQLWGRTTTLDLLRRHAHTRVPGTQARIAVLSGEPGSGRSHIAATHLRAMADKLDLVRWIRAGNEVTFEQEFVDFANDLGIDTVAADATTEVRRYLETTAESWLLVVDEAHDSSYVEHALPRQGNGQVIVTSSPGVSWNDSSEFVVARFSDAEASAHLVAQTRSDTPTAEAAVSRLGGLPICLDIATAVANHRGSGLGDYLVRLDVAEVGAEPTAERSALDAVVSTAVDEVRTVSVLAAATLQSLGYTAEAPIPNVLLAGFDDLGESTLPEGGTTRLLHQLGLIDAGPSSCSVHPLVRASLRHGRQSSGEQAPVELLFDHLDLAFDRLDTSRPGDASLAARLVPHAIEAARHGMRLNIRTESAAGITARSAHYLLATGAPIQETSQFCERAVALTDEFFGADHPTTIAARRNLADALVESGQQARALDVQAAILNDCERTLGSDHPNTVVARANLASNYATYGDHQRALDLGLQARDDLIRLRGEGHPDTLRVRMTVAQAMAATGHADVADVELARLTEDMTRSLGPDDPSTLAARVAYASCAAQLGDVARAVALQTQAVVDSERVHGTNHPETLEQRRRLAELRAEIGDQPGSIQIHQQILRENEVRHGADHIETIIARNDLASALADVGELDRAIEMQYEVLQACERTLGARHPDTLTARNNLATSYGEAGRLTEAVELQQQVLVDHEQELGSDHPFTVAARSNLALALTSLGDHQRAAVLHARLADDHERSKGPDHPHTLTALHNLANSRAELGDQNEALELRKRVLSIRERVLGFEHPQTLAARNNLANSYAELGDHDSAYELRLRVLDDRHQILGPDHPQTLGARNNLANSCADRGDHVRALDLRKQVLADRERVLGPDHPNTITARNNLANSCAATGNHADALAHRQQTLADCERILGPDHPHSQTARANLISSYETLGATDAAEALRSGGSNGLVLDLKAEENRRPEPAPAFAPVLTEATSGGYPSSMPPPPPPASLNGHDLERNGSPPDRPVTVPAETSLPAAPIDTDSPRRGRRFWPRR